MHELKHSQLKKLEIIVQGEQQDFVLDLLERAGVSGWTVVHNLSGKGSHGAHDAHLMFNEDDVLVMIITAVPADIAEAILEGLTPFFNRHMGVVFSTDIQVSRLAKFQPPG
ncbi:transcriptional regulator [Thiohalocapsa halophila]|uniref:Transcriptional regulator n=1 Tax=Thiohalocapsa halophila TaxID=69359 RepID=A0ABS1CIG6_9GAMM|nr:P-II family nitrogen regulator [Thiohalocapsa halophila]MBK1631664.1 transcriptional regulator [Thiohalocapsa halophila]